MPLNHHYKGVGATRFGAFAEGASAKEVGATRFGARASNDAEAKAAAPSPTPTTGSGATRCVTGSGATRLGAPIAGSVEDGGKEVSAGKVSALASALALALAAASSAAAAARR